MNVTSDPFCYRAYPEWTDSHSHDEYHVFTYEENRNAHVIAPDASNIQIQPFDPNEFFVVDGTLRMTIDLTFKTVIGGEDQPSPTDSTVLQSEFELLTMTNKIYHELSPYLQISYGIDQIGNNPRCDMTLQITPQVSAYGGHEDLRVLSTTSPNPSLNGAASFRVTDGYQLARFQYSQVHVNGKTESVLPFVEGETWNMKMRVSFDDASVGSYSLEDKDKTGLTIGVIADYDDPEKRRFVFRFDIPYGTSNHEFDATSGVGNKCIVVMAGWANAAGSISSTLRGDIIAAIHDWRMTSVNHDLDRCEHGDGRLLFIRTHLWMNEHFNYHNLITHDADSEPIVEGQLYRYRAVFDDKPLMHDSNDHVTSSGHQHLRLYLTTMDVFTAPVLEDTILIETP
jgi:hypothetical protein